MSFFKRFWNRFSSKKDSPQSLLAKKNELASRLAVVFLTVSIPYLILFTFLQMKSIQILVVATMGFFLVSILLYRYEWFEVGKSLLVLGPTLTFFGTACILGSEAGAQYLLFSLVALPLILFRLDQLIWMVGCSLAPILGYLLLELGEYNWIPYHELISIEMLFYIRIFVILSTFLLIILSAIGYFISNKNYESKLKTQNQELEFKNAELEKVYLDLKEKSELDKEIQAARTIQESVLPRHAPKFRHYEIDHFFMPAKQVSGDYFDYFPLSSHKIGILIADVVGKGIPASMMMITFKGLMHNIISAKLSPAKTCEMLNKTIFTNTILGKYVPVIYGILDAKAHTFTYCNAGHEPAWFVQADKSIELREGGMPLGAFETQLFDEDVIHLAPQDRVVLFTDGVTDAQNLKGEKLQIEQAIKLFQNRIHNINGTSFVGAVGLDILDYIGGANQTDDITIMSFKREA